MNRRRILGIVGAILLTIFGTVVLLAYVNSADRRAQQGAVLIDVLVATEPIQRGTAASEIDGRFKVVGLPQEGRAKDAVTDVRQLGNRVAATDIVPGEQLLTSKFVAEDQVQQGADGQALDDPENQTVTIALESQRAAGGRISAGQRVGVVASFDGAELSAEGSGETVTAESTTQMLLQRVRVAAVGGGPNDEGEGGAGGALMVSLEVDATDALRLVFAAEHGRIWLTQQTDQTVTEGGQAQTLGNILQPGDSPG